MKGIFFGLTIVCLCAIAMPALGQSPQQKADQLLEKGLNLMNKARFKKANKYLKKATELYIKLDQPVSAAHCYNHLSSNNRLMSNLGVAQNQAQEALNLLQGMDLDDPTERIRAYTNLGLLAAMRAEYNRSLKLLEKASKLIDDPAVSSRLKMVVLGSLGYLYDDMGKYDKAIYYYNRSLDILMAQPEPSKYRMALLYNNLGVAYSNKGLYKKSRRYYQRELKINLAVKGEDHPAVAGSYLNLGGSYFRSGDFGEALIYFKHALQIIKKVYGYNHSMTVIALNSLAGCEIELGNYKKAIPYLKQAIEIKKEISRVNHPELAISYVNLAHSYSQIGKSTKAKHFFIKALEIRKKNLRDNHPNIADSYNALAKFLLDNGHTQKAIKYLLNAREILISTVGSRHPTLASTYAGLGRAYAQQGKVVKSISFFQNALSIIAPTFNEVSVKDNPKVDKIIYPVMALSVLKAKAETLCYLYEKQNNQSLLKAALYTYYRLSKIIDKQQWGYSQLNSKLTITRESYKIYEQAIDATYELYKITGNRSLLQLIFYFAEKSKGRVLLEAIAQSGNKKLADIPVSVLERGQELKYALSKVKQALLGYSKDSTLADRYTTAQLKDSLFTLNRKLSLFTRTLEKKYPKYYRLKYTSKFPNLVRVQNRLAKRDATIIEYFSGKKHLYAIVITPDKIWVEPLTFSNKLDKKIKTFRKHITDGTKNFTTLGRSLYKILIKPIQQYLNSSQSILIVPSGNLRLLPFGALLTEPINSDDDFYFSQLPYLIKNYNISYATSIALNIAITKNGTGEYKFQFMGIAPIFGPENLKTIGQTVNNSTKRWRLLAFSDYEVQTIASKFKKDDSFWGILPWVNTRETKVLIGAEATESNFKSEGSLSARYIHLATHAFANDKRGKKTGIVFYQNDRLGNDDILYTNEIYNLQLNTQLVVLSACKTGLGNIIPGEGIMGLSRAFQYAGANNLVVSLWKVGDRSTAKLMIAFYTKLRKEYSMPKALSMAKRIIIHTRRYAHPKFWAAFKLIGSTALEMQ